MGLAQFQRVLSLMTLDAALAAAVRHQGGEALVAHQGLTDLERRRLVAVARQPGMELNCTLARANRFAAVHDAYPMTCVLLGSALRAVLDTLWSGHHPYNVQLAGDAERFAEVVLEHPAAEALASPYLGEVLAYERCAHQLALGVRHVADPQAWVSEPRWVAFDHEPMAVLAPLQAFHQPPAGLPHQPHRLRLQVLNGELETVHFAVQVQPPGEKKPGGS